MIRIIIKQLKTKGGQKMKLILSKKQAEVLDYILSNAETNISTRDELDSIDRKSLEFISYLKVQIQKEENKRFIV